MKPKNVKCEIENCKTYASAWIHRNESDKGLFVCKKHFNQIKRQKTHPTKPIPDYYQGKYKGKKNSQIESSKRYYEKNKEKILKKAKEKWKQQIK